MNTEKMSRCPNGSRRDKHTKKCVSNKKGKESISVAPSQKTTRCPKGTRRNKTTGNCTSNKNNRTTIDNAPSNLFVLLYTGDGTKVIGVFSSKQKASDYLQVTSTELAQEMCDDDPETFTNLEETIDTITEDYKIIMTKHLKPTQKIYVIQSENYRIDKDDKDDPSNYLTNDANKWARKVGKKIADAHFKKKCTLTLNPTP